MSFAKFFTTKKQSSFASMLIENIIYNSIINRTECKMSNVDTFIVSLKRAIFDREEVTLGGGTFTTEELRDVLYCLNEANKRESDKHTCIVGGKRVYFSDPKSHSFQKGV